MNKIRTILVDDEIGSLSTLEQLLEKYCPAVLIIGKARNPVEAKELITDLNPDLVFLDIEMPYGNAFDMLDKMKDINFEVVFVTAFNNYALKAFRYAAADYLLKPVNIEELQEAVNRISARIGDKKTNNRVTSLLENLENKSGNFRKIMLPISDGFLLEDISNIMYLHADGSYTYVFLPNNRKICVSKNLKEFEDILPETIFFRIHHSSIININYVKKYTKGRGGEVEMQDGETILISTRRKTDFFSKIRQ